MHVRSLLTAALCALLVVGLAPLAGAAADSPDITDRTSRIVGGDDAPEGAYLWMTSVHLDGDGNPLLPAGFEEHWCGASLISPGWLLTAAHCFDGIDGQVPETEDPSRLTAYVGLHDQTDLSGGVERAIVDIVLHPDWDDETFDNDIALLQLADPVEDVEPIAITVPADEPVYAPGEDVRTMGWGDLDEGAGDFPDVLQEVVVQRVDDAACNAAYFSLLNMDVTICAGVEGGGKDACQGDSGGPLIVDDAFGFPVQVGIVSSGIGCAQADFPGLYTRLGAFGDWVADQGVEFAPIAVAGGPYQVATGESVTLDASGSRLGGTEDLTYTWDLSDLGLDDATGATPEISPEELGTFTVTLTVTDGDGQTDTDTAEVTVVQGFEFLRITGANRYDTAANVARETFADGADLVVLANGEVFADGLSAAPIASRRGAPLLLSTPDALPSEISDVLVELDPAEVLVVGGTAAISDGVVAEIEALIDGVTVERIGGSERIETSNRLALATWRQGADTVYLAKSDDFPDALAGASAAGLDDAPLLLSTTEEIPQSTIDVINELNPNEIVLLGGTVALSANVEAQASGLASSVVRLSGPERMATAAAIAGRFGDYNSAWLTTAYAFPDALVAGPAAASEAAPLLLVAPQILPDGTAAELADSAPMRIVVVGGTNAVSDDVADAATSAAGFPQ